MQLGRVRLGNKGGGGASDAIQSVMAPTVNIPDLNVAIDSLEDDRHRKVADANDQLEDDAKIEKSSQFDDYIGEIENDYDDEDGDEDEENSQEVNLNFSAMLYSSKHRVVNQGGRD